MSCCSSGVFFSSKCTGWGRNMQPAPESCPGKHSSKLQREINYKTRMNIFMFVRSHLPVINKSAESNIFLSTLGWVPWYATCHFSVMCCASALAGILEWKYYRESQKGTSLFLNQPVCIRATLRSQNNTCSRYSVRMWTAQAKLGLVATFLWI